MAIVIPTFNCSINVRPTIRSIQNQNFYDFEVIIIDDCSSDDTIQVIEELQKEDSRIKLIKNNINRGTLYSRSIGSLYSKGKYIMSIDNDDLFINGIFDICYKEAIKYNLDIIEFSGFNLGINDFLEINPFPYIPGFLQYKLHNLVVKQPELSNFIYQKIGNSFRLIDALIWGKFIKKETYKNSLELIGKDIYTKNVCWSEDRIVNTGLFKVANSFKFINIYGIIHFTNPFSVSSTWEITKMNRIINDEFIFLVNHFKLAKSEIDGKIALYELNQRLNYFSANLTLENKKNSNILFKKILACKYIEMKVKENLADLFKKIK